MEGSGVETRIQDLSEAELGEVHERTLAVLERVGMRCDSAAGRRVLAEAGARVDEETRMVRFPAELVERSLAAAPRWFSLGGRRSGWSHPLNEGAVTLLVDGGATATYDYTTRSLRSPTHGDWLAATRIHDALDDVGVYWCATEYPPDYDRPAGFVRYFSDVFATFGKHVQDSFGTPELAPWLKEILDVVFGGRERVRDLRPFSFLITPASPLTIERDFTDSWLALRDYGLPVAVMPMPLQGATAPGSRLATLLTANCETVGTLCLVQAAAPGTPVIYAPMIATMDPRTGLYAAGAVEEGVLSVAGTEMARHYGLPVEAAGFCTRTFAPDMQTAWEKASGALLATLSRPDILVGPGMLGGATILSLEQIVLDVEVSRLARQASAGVPVRDDLWLDDVLESVGPGGSFLGQRSTRANARSGEWRLGDLGVYGSSEAWAADGSPSSLEYAHRRVAEILDRQQSLPYDDDVAAALVKLEKRAAADD